jgi:protein-disulfide isomerase
MRQNPRALAEPPDPIPTASPRRRILLGAIVVAVAAAVVALAAVLSGGGTHRPAAPATHGGQGHASQSAAQAVSTLLAGVPQSGTRLGAPSAPVTLYYFGDLECPVCRDFTLLGGLSELIEHDVRAGKVKVVYRSLCTATCNGPGPQVFEAQQVAAYAAGMQQRFWDYAEIFYREQGQEDTGYVTEAYLDSLARQTPGLNYTLWKRDRGDPSLLSQVLADEREATKLKLPGTPSLILRGPRGAYEVPETVPTYGQLEQAIARVS